MERRLKNSGNLKGPTATVVPAQLITKVNSPALHQRQPQHNHGTRQRTAAQQKQQQEPAADSIAVASIIPQPQQQPMLTNLSSNNNHVTNDCFNNINNNNNKSVEAAAAALPIVEQQHLAIPTKVISTPRNKNEEAINDLRTRIPEIENIFDIHSRIGNGTFSTVLLGTLKKESNLPENHRRKFAIKHHIPTSHPDRIMKELQCMAKIGGSNNVVGINCCIRYNESVAFIMPYLAHDRFHDFFSKMDVAEVQYYMKNLLIALRHVHRFKIIHRDVKPSNFLYNRRKRQFLLVDFGLAQQVAPSIAANAASSVQSEAKRLREHDDNHVKKSADGSAVAVTGAGEVVSGTAKRIRCTGPDLLMESGTANKSLANAVNTGSTLNQAATAGSGGVGVCTNEESPSIPPARKSGGGGGAAALTAASAISSRLQQKLRAQGGAEASSNRSSSMGVVGGCGAGGSNKNAPTPGSNGGTSNASDAKYNTNRNLSSTNSPKCFCYGNPQVCNICLVKKEIHASRAGTPGYRPPEVLLKYPDQTTAVDIWASGVIFLSVLSSVYPFFKAPNDHVALAEMVTIFGDKAIRKTAFILDRLVTLSHKMKPLDLRKLSVRFRNRVKFSSPELLKKYQNADGTCEVCKNCEQFYFNCLCTESNFAVTEPLDDDDIFPPSAYDLLYRLLEVNPHRRITADEALNHPFFQECYNNNNNQATTTSTTTTITPVTTALAAAGGDSL
uniref:non-specific serine/threonine protein kinase n=1 Tax=Stomoxys calcitrans TaxID=35570 RepID=A0A1I8PF17_STOCA